MILQWSVCDQHKDLICYNPQKGGAEITWMSGGEASHAPAGADQH